MFSEEDVEPWQKDLKSWKNRRKSSTKSFDFELSNSIDYDPTTSLGVFDNEIKINSKESSNTKTNKHTLVSKKWNKYPLNEEEDGWVTRDDQAGRLEGGKSFDSQNCSLTFDTNEDHLYEPHIQNDDHRKVEKVIKICQSRTRKSFGFEIDRASDGSIVISKITKGSSADICELRVADVVLNLNQGGMKGREVQEVKKIIEESVKTGNLVLRIERVLASDDTDDDDVDSKNNKNIKINNGEASLLNAKYNMENNNDAISKHNTTAPTKLDCTGSNVNNFIDGVNHCSIRDSVHNVGTPPPPLPPISPPHLPSSPVPNSTTINKGDAVTASSSFSTPLSLARVSSPASPTTPPTASSSFPSPPTFHQNSLNSPRTKKDNNNNYNKNNNTNFHVDTLTSHDDKSDKNATADKFRFFGLDSSCSEELKMLKDNKTYVPALASLNDKMNKSLKVSAENPKRSNKSMLNISSVEPNFPDKAFKSKLNLFAESLDNETKIVKNLEDTNVKKSEVKNNNQINFNANSISKLSFQIKGNPLSNNDIKSNKENKYDLRMTEKEGKFQSLGLSKEESDRKLKKYELELERMKEMEKVEKIKLERLKEEKKLELLKKRRMEEEQEIERLKRISQQEKKHNIQNQQKKNITKAEHKNANNVAPNIKQHDVDNYRFKVPFGNKAVEINKQDTTDKHHYYRQHSNNTNIDDVIDDINKKSERTFNEVFSNLHSKTSTVENKTNITKQHNNTYQHTIKPHHPHEHSSEFNTSSKSNKGNAYSRIVNEVLKEAGLENDRFLVDKIIVENKPIQTETKHVEKSELNLKLKQANEQLNNKFNKILGENQKYTKPEKEFLHNSHENNKNKMDKSINKPYISDDKPKQINRTPALQNNHDNNNNFNNLGEFVDNNNVKNKSGSDWLFNYNNNLYRAQNHLYDNCGTSNALNINQPCENAYENMDRNNVNARQDNIKTQNETNISYLLYGDDSNENISLNNMLINKIDGYNNSNNNNNNAKNNKGSNDGVKNNNTINSTNEDKEYKSIQSEGDKRQLKDFKRYFSKNWLITEVSARMNKSQKDNQKSPTKVDVETAKNTPTSPTKSPHTSPFFKPFKNLTFNKEQKKQIVCDKAETNNLEPSKGPYRLRCPSDNTFNIRAQSPTFNRINKNLIDIPYNHENSYGKNKESVDSNKNEASSNIYDNIRIENNFLGNRSKSLSSELVDNNTSGNMTLQYNKKLYNPYYNGNQNSYPSQNLKEYDELRVKSYTLNKNQNVTHKANTNNNLMNISNNNGDILFNNSRNAQNFYIKSGPMPYKKPDPKRLSLASNFQ